MGGSSILLIDGTKQHCHSCNVCRKEQKICTFNQTNRFRKNVLSTVLLSNQCLFPYHQFVWLFSIFKPSWAIAWYTSVETSHIWVSPFINIDKHWKHWKHWHALMETSHIWNLNAASGIFSGKNKIYSANKYSMHYNFNTCKTFKILTANSIQIFRMVTDVGKIWYSLGDWIALRCTLYEYMDVSRAMDVSHSALSDQKLTSFICTFSWNNLI